MKKTLTTLAIAASLTFVGAGATQAATYPAPVVGTISETDGSPVQDGVVPAGVPFTFSGAGFEPGEPITVTVTSGTPSASGAGAGIGGSFGAAVVGVIIPKTVLASTNADDDGVFAATVTLTEPGSYTLTAVGEISGHTVQAPISVAAPGDGTGDDNGTGNGGGAGTGAGTGNEEAVANGEQLADTGFDSSALLWGGAGVLALGAGATAVVVSRRKNA